MLTTSRGLRHRWLTADGTFSSDPGLALRLFNPEVVAHRLQTFMELHGWGAEVMERFRLVPLPARPSVSVSAGVKRLPLRTTCPLPPMETVCPPAQGVKRLRPGRSSLLPSA